MPEAPMGLEHSTPPLGFHGMSPSKAVAPSAVSFQPSPSAQKPRFSSHMGSNHEKGTYTSATPNCFSGSVMPPSLESSAVLSRPAGGATWSRPANMVGSLRMAPAVSQAGGVADESTQ